jgi:uncharacterized protein (TIGR03382 family)
MWLCIAIFAASTGFAVLARALDARSLVTVAKGVAILAAVAAAIFGVVMHRRKLPGGELDFTDGIADYPLEDLNDSKRTT